MAEQLSEQDIFESATPAGASEREERQPDQSPQETVRAENERPTPNLGQLPAEDEGEGEGEPRQAEPHAPPRRSMLDDLKSERERRKEIEKERDARDRELAEMRGMLRAMQSMSQQGQGRPQAPEAPKPAPQAPDPFEDPQGFAAFQAQQVFERQFSPVQQQIQQRDQRYDRMFQGLQRGMAAQVHGAKEAKEAEEAFNTAAAQGAIDPYEHQRIQSADNPYAAAVEWHQRQRVHTQVGNDPEAWFKTELERRVQQDPALQQHVYALLQGQAQAAGAQAPAAGKPPVFTGLPSLNAAAGTSGRAPTSMTEAELFNTAPPKIGQRR